MRGDEALVAAVQNIDDGLVSASLGGDVIKQRVARDGEGQSSGLRTVVILKQGVRRYSFMCSPRIQKKHAKAKGKQGLESSR
jgi:hypothetical protein